MPPLWGASRSGCRLVVVYGKASMAFQSWHRFSTRLLTKKVKSIGRDIQGVSLGGKILLDLEAGTKTLIHEIAHEMLHHVEGVLTSSTIRQLEAESVAYVVAKHFGMNGLSSPNYNALKIGRAHV